MHFMLKQGAPKESSSQEALVQKPESTASPKQQMDAIVSEQTNANALSSEIGASLREGKFSPEEKAGIIDVLVKQSNDRSALAIAKGSGLPPEQIRALFVNSFIEDKMWRWVDDKDSVKRELPQPTETIQPVYTDLAKRLAQEKIDQRSELFRETTPAYTEQQAWIAANRLLKDRDNLLDQKAYSGLVIKHNLRNLVTKNLKEYLNSITSPKGAAERGKVESVEALLDYITANTPKELDLDKLSKLSAEVSSKLTAESRGARPHLSVEFRDLPTIKARPEVLESLRDSDPSPERRRSLYVSKRADVLSYAKAAYSDTDIPKRVAEKMGRTRSPSKSINEAFDSSYSYESAQNSGDPKEEPIEIATLSEPYQGMLYKKKYANFNVATNRWTEADNAEDLQAQPIDEGDYITVTIPNQSRNQILPKPLHDPMRGTQAYIERKEGDYEIKTVESGTYGISTRGISSTEAPKLHYDFSPDKPHSPPAKLTLDEYSQRVESPSPELREYATSSLPEHAQLFLKGVEALPVADQVRLIEAYSKKYGFYDFDNGEVLTTKSSLQGWKDQIQFMQDRLTELSLVEETSGKLYAGVCTDFQTLTTAMLLSKGLKASVGTGFLVNGETIKTTDAHALSLVELPTQNGAIETFEVDGTPVAGTAGSEKTLAEIQRSAFQEQLTTSEEALNENISSESEKRSNQSIEDKKDLKNKQAEQEKQMDAHHIEALVSLTLNPQERLQARSMTEILRWSGLLTLNQPDLEDPKTTVWLNKNIDNIVDNTSEKPGNDPMVDEKDLVKNISGFHEAIQQLPPEKKAAIKRVLDPITKNILSPKLAALFKIE